MRILMLNHNLIGRGSFLRCRPLARELVRLGHNVSLVTASDSFSPRWREHQTDGVRVLVPPRLGTPRRHDGGYAPIDILCRIPTALKKWDLIHAFEHRPNVSIPALVSRLRGTPLVTDWSDWWTRGGITTPRRRFQFVDRWEAVFMEEGTKKISDHVIVVSRALETRARSIGIGEEHLHRIPSGCDHQRVRPRDKTECRSRIGLPKDVPVLGFSGFAFWDFRFLVQAFRQVLREVPEAHLLVIGQDKDEEIGSITRRELGESSSRVLFAGRFEPSELEIPLGAADIQLLPLADTPANRARWPIKFGDYAASSRPVVLCNVGDVPEVVRKYQVGKVTDPTPAEFARGIVELLKDTRAAEQMGTMARKLAEGPLSWEQMARRMEQVYQKCLSVSE